MKYMEYVVHNASWPPETSQPMTVSEIYDALDAMRDCYEAAVATAGLSQTVIVGQEKNVAEQ